MCPPSLTGRTYDGGNIDISLSNVLLTFNEPFEFDLDQESFLEALGGAEPYFGTWSSETPRSERLPGQIVKSATWYSWFDSTEEDIRIIDWGSSFPMGTSSVQRIGPQPLELRCPETFFLHSFNHKDDLWRAGYVVIIFCAYQVPVRTASSWAHLRAS